MPTRNDSSGSRGKTEKSHWRLIEGNRSSLGSMAPPYIHSTPVEIEVIEPVAVNGILYLPAVYLAA